MFFDDWIHDDFNYLLYIGCLIINPVVLKDNNAKFAQRCDRSISDQAMHNRQFLQKRIRKDLIWNSHNDLLPV